MKRTPQKTQAHRSQKQKTHKNRSAFSLGSNKVRLGLLVVLAAGLLFAGVQAQGFFFSFAPTAPKLVRVTGADMAACAHWQVCGTDLGISYKRADGSLSYVFGDTFRSRNPEDSNNGWRGPTILHTSANAAINQNMFTSAARVTGNGFAPGVISGTPAAGEATAIPNDGISIPELGAEIVSYQSVKSWNAVNDENWQTNYSGLAVSTDGGNIFNRTGPTWVNDAGNNDSFQMQSMQRDGNYVYMISVPAGRQNGSMMLQRVPATQILNKSAYQCLNGNVWGSTCTAILTGRFGEPSLRKLSDGTWVMAYLDINSATIVTRTASSPTGPWSWPKNQLTASQLPNLYGGFINPYSTRSNTKLSVSTWQRNSSGSTQRYDVSILTGSL